MWIKNKKVLLNFTEDKASKNEKRIFRRKANLAKNSLKSKRPKAKLTFLKRITPKKTLSQIRFTATHKVRYTAEIILAYFLKNVGM